MMIVMMMCVWLVLVGGGGQPNTYMAGNPQVYLVTNGSSLGCSDYFSKQIYQEITESQNTEKQVVTYCKTCRNIPDGIQS